MDPRRQEALVKFQQKLGEHRQLEANLKSIREKTNDLEKSFNKSEDDLKALQSVGQVGECVSMCVCVCVRCCVEIQLLVCEIVFFIKSVSCGMSYTPEQACICASNKIKYEEEEM